VGCLVGLLSFSRLLNYFLIHFRALTMAFLTGLMIGAMPKIWPWKQIMATEIIRGKTHVTYGSNIIPESINSEVLAAIGLAIIGFVAVMVIERLARVRKSDT
jgi:putative membrane protein